MKRLILIILSVLMVFTLIGCSKSPVQEPPTKEQAAPQPPPEPSKPKYYAPLTGLPVEEEINHRIIGVMINNHSKARPQSGLNQADMVYEILAEGTITRFLAVFHSQQPEIIGPVRSIRPYYIEIMKGLDSLVVHAGQSTEAAEMLKKGLPDVDGLVGDGTSFWRSKARKAPHNLYTSTENINQFASDRGYRLAGDIPTVKFLKEDEIISGEPAKNITVQYDQKRYIVGYEYDESSKLYKRTINNKPHTDLETDEQLTAKNVLVIRAKHWSIGNTKRGIDIDGPGKGYLFQNGQATPIEWKMIDGVVRAYVNGVEQGLYPGQTWIMVVEPQTSVSYQ